MARRRLLVRVLVAAAVIALLVAASRWARGAIGIEINGASIQAWVEELGWWGPLAFLGVSAARHLLAIPSIVLLPAAGACFGALWGGVLGATGVVLTGLLHFWLLRTVRPESLMRYTEGPIRKLRNATERGGPWLVGLVTAHPTAPMSPVQWAAAFTPMTAASFALALTLGALVRAFSLAYFGDALFAEGSVQLYVASAALLAMIVLPLLHRPTRERLFPPALDQAR